MIQPDRQHTGPDHIQDFQGPEPSAAHLGPRAFSTGVVDSLGDILADCTLWSLVLLGVGN